MVPGPGPFPVAGRNSRYGDGGGGGAWWRAGVAPVPSLPRAPLPRPCRLARSGGCEGDEPSFGPPLVSPLPLAPQPLCGLLPAPSLPLPLPCRASLQPLARMSLAPCPTSDPRPPPPLLLCNAPQSGTGRKGTRLPLTAEQQLLRSLQQELHLSKARAVSAPSLSLSLSLYLSLSLSLSLSL